MAGTRRSPSRPGAGPGRGTRTSPRSSTSPGHPSTGASGTTRTRAAEPVASPAPETDDLESVAETRSRAAARRRSSLTTRAIALAVVLLVLTISYASSLRVYLSQRHDIAATKADIATRQVAISELQGELNRWNDPSYVRTQARERFGWVVPGEIGYQVIGPDGKPIGTQAQPGSSTAPAVAQPKPWWSKLWGSVEAADAKPSAAPKPSKDPTISESTRPRR